LSRELLFRDPPYPHPERLVRIEEKGADGKPAEVSLDDFLDFREGTERFAHMAAFRLRSFGLRSDHPASKTRVIQVGLVTSDFFRTLGVEPIEGRSFTFGEEVEEAPVIVVTKGLGERTGGTVLLNEEARTVVGVLPDSFHYPNFAGGPVPDAYVPLSHRDYGGKRGVRSLTAIGRLRETAAIEEAGAELDAIAHRVASVHPDTHAGYSASLTPLKRALADRNVVPVALLSSAALALIGIVVTNLASLFLAQLVSRGREMAIRASLGARPWHLFRLVFTETLLLTLTGAALGLGLGALLLASLPPLVSLLGGFVPAALDLGSEGFLGAGFLAAAVAFFAAALVPIVSPHSITRAMSRAPSLQRFRRTLVALQIALAVLLVSTAGLLARSFSRLLNVEPGFETKEVYAFGIGLPELVYDSDAKLLSFHHRLLDRILSIPGIESGGVGVGRLLSRGNPLGISFLPEGATAPSRDWPKVSARVASPGYLETLGVAVVRGRGFEWNDDREHPTVVLVNRAFEEAFFPQGALGKRLSLSWRAAGSPFEIVGVVSNTRQVAMSEPPLPEILLSLAQFPPEGAQYVFRTSRADPALGDSIRDAVDALDGRLETVTVRSLDPWVRESVQDRRLSLILASTLALAAAVLAALGVYGILACWVSSRSAEIALRMALGATGSRIRASVVREGLKLTLLGVALGSVASAFGARFLRSLLFEVSAADGTVWTLTLAVIAAVAVAACVGPAMQAASVAPAEALRRD
jgi:putative ABC transport system permease protein